MRRVIMSNDGLLKGYIAPTKPDPVPVDDPNDGLFSGDHIDFSNSDCNSRILSYS